MTAIAVLPEPASEVRQLGSQGAIIDDDIVFTGVPAGHPACAGGTANGVRGVAFRKIDALGGQAIDVGCVNMRIAVTGYRPMA